MKGQVFNYAGKRKHNREHEEFKGTGSHNDNHGKNMVTIYVNDEAVAIHRGRQTVAEIKALGNVPQPIFFIRCRITKYL